MLDAPLPPLRFEPILKRLIWGGRRLGTELHKPIGDELDYAESWEISDHHDDVSRVSEGPLAGTTLRELIQTRGEELFGPGLAGLKQFPLLVKFIDANRVLSVQVHPNDEQGKRLVNDNGKTEAWVVLHVEPGSVIYSGLKPGVTKEEFAEAIEAGSVERLLHQVEPKPGDCILIPAGTVHAIGAGVLLAEIQQMSDATFRVFDWNRVGPDGRPRQLHLQESLEVTDYSRGPVDPWPTTPEPTDWGTLEKLARSPYFSMDRLTLSGKQPATVGTSERFTILLGLGGTTEIMGPVNSDAAGEGSTKGTRLGYGETLLIPASLGACSIRPLDSQEATILTCSVP